jgi:hypothetical protein
MNIPPTSVVVHASSAAGLSLGAVGATLDGLLSSQVYNRQITRTVLLGPMYAADAELARRVFAPENGLVIHYSSLHHKFDGVSAEMCESFQAVEKRFEVAILYGKRPFGSFSHEVLLVDASNPERSQVRRFREHLSRHAGVDCERYSTVQEFNLHVTTAAPLWAALKALGVDAHDHDSARFLIAHDWPGMMTVFAAQEGNLGQWRTVFFAHETPIARHLVEHHPGHDTRFYNALFKAREWRLTLESVFGGQEQHHFHAVTRQAARCDAVLAVGDLAREELRFLGGGLSSAPIDIAYAGLFPEQIDFEARQESRRRLQAYAKNLLGYPPDYVFTHVAEMTIAGGLWRDLRVLEHLDGLLRTEGKSAVLFVLGSSSAQGKRSDQIATWEERYGWPVLHRGDNGDLVGLEERLYFDGVEPFNRRAGAAKVILVNQFGWNRERCGRRMPAEMEFPDIRRGADLEFGQNIYAPFGAAALQPITFGALSCVSNVCGCVGLLSRLAGNVEHTLNVIVADYCTLPPGFWLGSPYDALAIDQGVRDWIEGANSARAAHAIFQRLPRSEEAGRALLFMGFDLAERMSWDAVAYEYFLPALAKVGR